MENIFKLAVGNVSDDCWRGCSPLTYQFIWDCAVLLYISLHQCQHTIIHHNQFMYQYRALQVLKLSFWATQVRLPVLSSFFEGYLKNHPGELLLLCPTAFRRMVGPFLMNRLFNRR